MSALSLPCRFSIQAPRSAPTPGANGTVTTARRRCAAPPRRRGNRPPSLSRVVGLIGRTGDCGPCAAPHQCRHAKARWPAPPASTGSSAADPPAIDPGTPYRRRPMCDDRAVWSRASSAVHAASADNSISFRYERNELAKQCHGGSVIDRHVKPRRRLESSHRCGPQAFVGCR
jgi:hypothetical protein